MLIHSINNYSNLSKNQRPQFKSVYPVVHWLAETNASYSPALTHDSALKLNKRIVEILNLKAPVIEEEISKLMAKVSELNRELGLVKSVRQKESKEKKIATALSSIADLRLSQRVQAYIARNDKEYDADNPIVRGFYDRQGGFRKGNYDSVAYIATGEDALYLNNLGKQIGVERSKGNKIGEERARDNYQKLGREHVQARAAEFRRVNSEPSELHVKMEIKRDGVGDKVGYNISEMKYFPKEGPNNPFMLTEWAKR